jgi:aspartate-semialdehyde dehydrogenase
MQALKQQQAQPLSHRPALAAPLEVAIVGATGAVGREMVACLEKRNFPVSRLRLYASERSAGRALSFRGERIVVEALDEKAFAGVDLAFFASSAEVSRHYVPAAVKAGALVIDNSSAFRMDPSAPLVVPEANGGAAFGHEGVIANPNCVAAIAVMALAPLHARVPIRRVIAATYQAASGGGAEAMEELWESTGAYLHGRPFRPKALAHPYAFNLFSHDTPVDAATGANAEEAKVMQELRKLLDASELLISVTCVRVPVLRAHSMALTVEFERPLEPEEALRILTAAPGIRVVNDVAANRFPMPVEAAGRDEVLAGRVRLDPSDPEGRTLSLFVVGDQLLKGAALNAVQIAELLMSA